MRDTYNAIQVNDNGTFYIIQYTPEGETAGITVTIIYSEDRSIDLRFNCGPYTYTEEDDKEYADFINEKGMLFRLLKPYNSICLMHDNAEIIINNVPMLVIDMLMMIGNGKIEEIPLEYFATSRW